MAKQELVEAYIQGRIGRREFIKGLSALGLSTATAIGFAKGLKAAPGGTARNNAGYVVSRDDEDYDYGDDDDDDDTGGGTTLPNTGSGAAADSSGSAWLKPLAVAGAGAAFVASRLRRGTEPQA